MKFALHFLRHPNRVPRLIQFATTIGQARETLASAIVTLVRELRP